MNTQEGKPTCLIVDWGGVLTVGVQETWHGWAQRAGLDVAHFDAVLQEMIYATPGNNEAASWSHLYERGEISDAEFEQYLANRLRRHDGSAVEVDGLLLNLWKELAGVPDMVEVVRRAKWHGLATALLSNSWGLDPYDRTEWDDLFDAVVISGEVGMRKPDPEIFLYTAEQVNMKPHQCVFVDDIITNVQAANAVGMIGVHHVDVASTVAELEAIFGLECTI
jgi:putative hydrolase of the HAD superfamily